MKRCVGPCRQELPLDAFRPDRHRGDGLNCYCRPCAKLMSRRVSKMTAMGRTRTNLVPAGPVRAHVEQLLIRGMTRHQIAELAGVGRSSVRNLTVGQPTVGQGPAKRVRQTTAAALLSVTFTPCYAPVREGKARQAGASVDNTGTRRRLEALMANGWPARDLAARLGHRHRGLQIPRHHRCSAGTAAAVRALYDELAETPGPSAYARTLYRGRGYLHPGWWDADTIDDPDAEPDGLTVSVLTRRGPVEVDLSRDRAVLVESLARAGLSSAEIAEQIGSALEPVQRARRQLRREAA